MARRFAGRKVVRQRISLTPERAFYPKGSAEDLAKRLASEDRAHVRAMIDAGRPINKIYRSPTVAEILANAQHEAEARLRRTGEKVTALDVLRGRWTHVSRGRTRINLGRLAKKQYKR